MAEPEINEQRHGGAMVMVSTGRLHVCVTFVETQRNRTGQRFVLPALAAYASQPLRGAGVQRDSVQCDPQGLPAHTRGPFLDARCGG